MAWRPGVERAAPADHDKGYDCSETCADAVGDGMAEAMPCSSCSWARVVGRGFARCAFDSRCTDRAEARCHNILTVSWNCLVSIKRPVCQAPVCDIITSLLERGYTWT